MTIHPDANVDECMEEISALEAEIERLTALAQSNDTITWELLTKVTRLRAALDRAADALEFYDNKAESLKARAVLKDTK